MSGGGLGGSRPIQRATAYVASKSATVTLVEALAIELLEENITVNAIAPGFFPTSFMSEAKNVGPEVAGNDLYSDATQTADESTEESLAQLFTVVDFLMSPEASVISGRIISARWDTQEAVLDLSKSSNAFRLRRVDEILIKDAK
jgi:NAD(P)-dependent dehydrogenase (short-subunit alcohol dehydrogenase family)